jgi:hypothetical protein
MDVYRNLIWPRRWKNGGFDDARLAIVETEVANLMRATAEPMLGEAVYDYEFTLPWNRMFEVNVEMAK